jgi:hypothetical protein
LLPLAHRKILAFSSDSNLPLFDLTALVVRTALPLQAGLHTAVGRLRSRIT